MVLVDGYDGVGVWVVRRHGPVPLKLLTGLRHGLLLQDIGYIAQGLLLAAVKHAIDGAAYACPVKQLGSGICHLPPVALFKTTAVHIAYAFGLQPCQVAGCNLRYD